jgi:phosphotriesterase-related protein
MMLKNAHHSSACNRRDMMRRVFGAGVGVGFLRDFGAFAEGEGAAIQAGRTSPSQAAPPGAIIRTIVKDLDPAAITGRTLVHEHLGSGGRSAGATPQRPSEDVNWMAEELTATKKHGVACIVAAQTSMPGPEVAEYLKQLSERTGIHVVATGAFYMGPSYPPDVKTKSEEQIADDLVRAAGAGRFGAFGEIGVGPDQADLSPEEKKVYRAIGRAHTRTRLPIITHNNYSTGPRVPMDMGLRQLDTFEAAGVKPQSLAIGHVCCLNDPKAEIAQRIAKRGAFVAFDRLTRQQQWMTDEQRLKMVMALLEAGFVDHLLMSSDYGGTVVASVGEKEFRPGPFLARDGGPGWARSLVWFVPMMQKAGATDDTLRRITVDNPRRFLAFVPAD